MARKKTRTLAERKKHARRYGDDSIEQTGRHFEAGIIPVRDVAKAAGISTNTLYAWAKHYGWKRDASQRVATVDGRGLLRMAGVEAVETARTKFADAPAAVSPAMLTAGGKAIAMAESWAEAQPANITQHAAIVVIEPGDATRIRALAKALGVDAEKALRLYADAGDGTLLIEGEGSLV